MALAGSQQLRAQDPMPVHRFDTEGRTGSQGRQDGDGDENSDGDGDGEESRNRGGSRNGDGNRDGDGDEEEDEREKEPGNLRSDSRDGAEGARGGGMSTGNQQPRPQDRRPSETVAVCGCPEIKHEKRETRPGRVITFSVLSLQLKKLR